MDAVSDQAPQPTLDELVVRWRAAFRAADAALAHLPDAARRAETRRLTEERAATQRLLETLARDHHEPRFLPIVVSPLEARRLLGLPPEITACVFNLDGVLIASAALHLAAWAATFDEFVLERSERTRGRFAVFNPRTDYRAHLHARPRLDGVREFLASRGIRLPEGEPDDAPGTETVHGLANRKAQVLVRLLDVRGVHPFEGSRSYLELAHEAGVRCAVVSASANTETILERAGLAQLIDARVDGTTIEREHLRVKPEPDTLLAACAELGVDARHAAAFETTRAGVVAGRRAGFDLIVGVDGAIGADRRDQLQGEGANVVVAEVGELLEQRIAA